MVSITDWAKRGSLFIWVIHRVATFRRHTGCYLKWLFTPPIKTLNTWQIVGSCSYNEGAIFDLHSTQVEKPDLCECGQIETVEYVLLDSRLGQTERKELRDALREDSSGECQDKLEVRETVFDSPFDIMKVKISERWTDVFQRSNFSWRTLRACIGGPLLMIHQRWHSSA